jgi:hypothetical protein
MTGHYDMQLLDATRVTTHLIGLCQALLQLQAQLLRHRGVLVALRRQGGL